MMMKSTLTILAALLLAAGSGTTGCRSSQTSDINEIPTAKMVVPPDSTDPEIEALNPEFTISRIDAGRYSFSFRAGGGGRPGSPSMSKLYDLRSLAFQIYAPNGEQLGSIATETINTSGIANAETGESSLTAFGGVEWESEKPLVPGTFAIAILRSDKGAYARRVEFPGGTGGAMSPAEASKSIHMEVEVQSRAGGVEFILTAERIAPGPDEEYLPSGEKYRIELRNDVGETVWSSSSGRMFTQALGPVQPGAVGEEVRYREFWDGRSELTRTPAPAGVYRLIATIPAQPTPYIIREEFTWSGR